ncbi:MAG: hypothetical protein COY66_04050 [Candidatus Kerfeldbacteria bacterium CG_4_10_14_0_8_um_filter_42_10]|uniref:Uncharacterized protein n=1 Tax=Candidatus Kerfeldbacteria bacterium CG_4_10_14_0_8_um_filter_42_10 TaxID=2014248 RepID=A0A2M7RI93_9BACT|nr:MAG: hypothetical protein COY66_04050 [Candidatus Kerfeldbacteria bacterium CG_4_10_14_0_8_um_filter_42_10]
MTIRRAKELFPRAELIPLKKCDDDTEVRIFLKDHPIKSKTIMIMFLDPVTNDTIAGINTPWPPQM